MPLSDEQFKTLMEVVAGNKKSSFATCTTVYEGERDSNTVEAFLAAISVFKEVEKISDIDALTGLPLVLKKDAATWWQGIKDQVITWEDFKKKLRHAFAPKKPAYIIYQELIQTKQQYNEPTEKSIAEKRVLLAQLPKPEHTEQQQLDMVFGQLNMKIKEKVPRTSVKTFDELIDKARAVEEVTKDKDFARTDKDAKREKGSTKKNAATFVTIWFKKPENIKIRYVVIINDYNLPAGKWAMGSVTEVHPGHDGLVRVVSLKTKNGFMKRPVAKLSILPLQSTKLETSGYQKEKEIKKENEKSKREITTHQIFAI